MPQSKKAKRQVRLQRALQAKGRGERGSGWAFKQAGRRQGRRHKSIPKQG